MTIRKTDYVDVQKRAADLRLQVPVGLALLPRNFADAPDRNDLVHESAVPTVRVLWREAGVEETRVELEGHRIATVSENAFEWVGPTIFVASAIWSQNPHAVGVALGVIANYVTDWFKGITGEKRVRLSLVVEKTKTKKCVKIDYDGPPEQMPDLAAIIKEVADE